MSKKELKVSMIFEGSFHRFGTVLEEEEIPQRLRKAEYLTEPKRKRIEQADQEVFDDDDAVEVVDEEGLEEESEPISKPSVIRRKIR